MFNKVSRIHIKTLMLTVIISCFVLIPKVMAMSFEEVVALKPYGVLAFFFGVGSALMRFAQRRFAKIKRGFDIFMAMAGLVITAPVIFISSILIKIISPQGSVFYTQNRVGKGGRIFKIYKLRTMKPDAEKETGAVWSHEEEGDPRVIPVIGNFLRKTHIDEIPQFFNVLKRDMSIVGPRPERPEIVAKLKKNVFEYEKRLSVRPGITGLAQIRHRYDKTLADVKKKVKLDLLYIRRMCLFAELSILLRTVIVVLKGKAIG